MLLMWGTRQDGFHFTPATAWTRVLGRAGSVAGPHGWALRGGSLHVAHERFPNRTACRVLVRPAPGTVSRLDPHHLASAGRLSSPSVKEVHLSQPWPPQRPVGGQPAYRVRTLGFWDGRRRLMLSSPPHPPRRRPQAHSLSAPALRAAITLLTKAPLPRPFGPTGMPALRLGRPASWARPGLRDALGSKGAPRAPTRLLHGGRFL